MAYIGNPIVSTDFPVDYASGNGSTTAFTLSVAPASVNSIDVQISGVSQSPQTYSVSGTTLTFSAAPPSGTNNIVVRHLGVAGIPNTPSAGSVVTTSIANNAVTQAKLASGVAGTGPAFSAYQSSAQSISAATYTKIQFQTEEFDTANCYDNTTNHRFTPNVAGYYQVIASVRVSSVRTTIQLDILKNGSTFKDIGSDITSNSAQTNGSALVYMNGTTDYIEIYTLIGATQNLSNLNYATYFQAFLVRAA